jgi:3-oxoacyl-[acyl-carrier protein] reductase
MFNFNEKVVFVTGSTRGIGREIALNFAKNGAKVIINGRKQTEFVTSLESQLKELNCDYFTVLGDVADKNFPVESLEQIIAKYGKVDILVNNAGIAKDNIALNMSFEDFDQVLDTNLNANFRIIKTFLPQMIENRYGKIINISSISGIYGNTGQANYASAKAGLNILTKVFAREIGRYNINVNAVAPGYVETDILGHVSSAMLQNARKSNPMRRFAKPCEIANLTMFLATDLCNYLNGETIAVDGGSFNI